MILDYKIYYPGGNATALVSQNVDAALRSVVAVKIMKQNPTIEQVGFLSETKNKLRLKMMGDELCVNAAQCAALYWHKSKKSKKIKLTIPRISEAIQSVDTGETIRLQFPKTIIRSLKTIPEGTLVNMSGIRYLLIESGDKLKINSIKKLILKHQANYPAVGVIQIIRKKNRLNIQPWIWVVATKTLVAETACGSGSIATGAFEYFKNPKQRRYQIVQPSGEKYKIEFNKKGVIIESKVQFVGEKYIKI